MNEAADIAAALDSARLAGMLPYLQAELRKMEEACMVRMDQLMLNGKLTPDLAQMAWIELIGYRRLRRRLEQKVRIGEAVGNKVAPVLNGEPPLPV